MAKSIILQQWITSCLQFALHLLEHGKITGKECPKCFKITRDTANRDFKKLIEVGLLEKRGIRRATHYVLKEG